MSNFNAIEPNRLKMIWQSSGLDRNKYVVGEVVRANNEYLLCYFVHSNDYVLAWASGFRGHPAFDYTSPTHHNNVLDILARRIPPRTRTDYPSFVSKFGLDPRQNFSDFLLLSFSHGKLPSDGFSFAVDFRFQEVPFVFNMEISGFRYSPGMGLDISTLPNQTVNFILEDSNTHDSNAVRVEVFGVKIGYVPRYYAEDFRRWSHFSKISAFIQRVEGAFTKPEVYLTVIITKIQS